VATLDELVIYLPSERLYDALVALPALGSPYPQSCPIEIVEGDKTITLPFGRPRMRGQRQIPSHEDLKTTPGFNLDLQIPFRVDDSLRGYVESEYNLDPWEEGPATVTFPFSAGVRTSLKDTPGLSSIVFYTSKRHDSYLAWPGSVSDTFVLFALEHQAECCCVFSEGGGPGVLLLVGDKILRAIVDDPYRHYQPLREELEALKGLSAADALTTSIRKHSQNAPWFTQELVLWRARQCGADISLFAEAASTPNNVVKHAAIRIIAGIGGEAAISALRELKMDDPYFKTMVKDAIRSIVNDDSTHFRIKWGLLPESMRQ
jgi:hypothetical protein